MLTDQDLLIRDSIFGPRPVDLRDPIEALQHIQSLIDAEKIPEAKELFRMVAQRHSKKIGDIGGVDASTRSQLEQFVSDKLSALSADPLPKPNLGLEQIKVPRRGGVSRTRVLRDELPDRLTLAFGPSASFRKIATRVTRALPASSRRNPETAIDLEAPANIKWCFADTGRFPSKPGVKRLSVVGVNVIGLTMHDDHVYRVALFIRKHERPLKDPAHGLKPGYVPTANYVQNCSVVLSITNIDDGQTCRFEQLDLFDTSVANNKHSVVGAIAKSLFHQKKMDSPSGQVYLRCFAGDDEFLRALSSTDLRATVKGIAVDIAEFLREQSPAGWNRLSTSVQAKSYPAGGAVK